MLFRSCLAVHRAIGAADGGQADLGLIEGLAAPVVDLSGGVRATRDRDGQSGGNATGPVHHRGHGSLGRALSDVTAHAEMQAVTMAANYLGGKYLNDCTLYVTLELCVMCAGALAWAHIGRVVFGAYDDKRGFGRFAPKALHPKTELVGGVMAQECGEILQRFFSIKR